jgi:hypothetical protein
MVALRERLQSGDVWVEGSRAFRAFDDFLLPRDAFESRRKAGELRLAVADRFEAWSEEKTKRLERAFAKSMRSPPPASCPRPRSARKACRSAQFAVAKTKRLTGLFVVSTPCCRDCASPNFSPKSMAGQALPIVSRICAPARRRMTLAP